MKRMLDVEDQVNQANEVGLSRLFFDEHSEHGMGLRVNSVLIKDWLQMPSHWD